MNRTLEQRPYPVGDEAVVLHKALFVADLHSDCLMWNRDVLALNTRGHVDLPRLVEGNVALQVFSAVTKVPKGLNYESNTGDNDSMRTLVILQRWPRRTWSSLLERALYQAQRLDDASKRSEGGLVVLRSRKDVEVLAESRRSGKQIVGGLLSIEGLHCLEGKLDNVDVLYNAGFRMMGLTHFFDNEVAGSAHGVSKGGLTDLGREVIRRIEERGIIVDLAHASPAAIDEVLLTATKPIVVSHTGVRGTCDNSRNLSDEQLEGIAKTGGLVGIGYWNAAVCEPNVESIVGAIRYVVDHVGLEHVALGSDFDGGTRTPFDATGLSEITDGLLNAGYSESDIAAIMGGNTLRVLRECLPAT
jgi:microsomal dipeptidase-like Zn-dependent dipeptidase